MSCLSIGEIQQAVKIGQSLLHEKMHLEEMVSFLQDQNESYFKEIRTLQQQIQKTNTEKHILQMKLNHAQDNSDILNNSSESFSNLTTQNDGQWIELNEIINRQQIELEILRSQLSKKYMQQSNLQITASLVEFDVFKCSKKWWKLTKAEFKPVRLKMGLCIEFDSKKKVHSFDDFVLLVDRKKQITNQKEEFLY